MAQDPATSPAAGELAAFFDSAVDLLAIIDFQGRWLHVSPSWTTVLGWTEQEVLDSRFPELVHPDDVTPTVEANRQVKQEGLTVVRFDNRYRRKDGSYQWLRWTGLADADAGFIHAIARPLSDDEKALEGRAQAIRAVDAIMDSPSTAIIAADLEGSVLSFSSGAEQMFGYSADEVIGQQISMLMPRRERSVHEAAVRQFRRQHNERPIRTSPMQVTGQRADGTPLPLLLSLSSTDGDPPLIVASILSLQDPVTLTPVIEALEAATPEDEAPPNHEATRPADPPHEVLTEDRSPIPDQRQPANLQEFVTHYQPIVRSDGSFMGMEALLRWEPPGQPIRVAQDFIQEAEHTGLITELDRVTIADAIRDTARLLSHGWWPDDAICTINLSPAQLEQPDIVNQFSSALEEHHLPAGVIGIEITESVILSGDPESLARLRQLRSLGCAVYLDDFGTGYASMSYLHQVPLDGIKPDRSFVQGVADDPIDAAIIASQLSLASLLNLTVVAEGVEEPRQLESLLRRGVRRFQGYPFSHPAPIDTISERLQGVSTRH